LGYSDPRWERARKPIPSEPIRFLEPKVTKWIKKHPFANHEWLKYHIKREEWFPEGNKKNRYYIMVSAYDGVEQIWVKIKFKYYPKDHIFVHHPHVQKRYRR